MDILSIISFLSPFGFSPFKVEILPIAFFSLILFLFVYTIFQVKKHANAENWEKNWHGKDGDASDDLDAEHGSILDLSDAVATRAEKIADVMPGIILIIGLLGTFIGLGLALDKASSILSSADASAMDSSMTQLMGMLEGLGAKFKTSTWGLLAFLLLKPIMAKDGYEERRLKWVIEKVKREFDTIRAKRAEQEQQRIEQITSGLAAIGSTITLQNERLLKQIRSWEVESLSAAADQKDAISQGFEDLQETLNQVPASIRKMNKETSDWLRQSVDLHQSVSNSMADFIAKNDEVVDKLGKSAQGMSSAAQDMGKSASHLQDVITDFRTNMESVIDLLKSDLNQTIQDMNGSFASNMDRMSNDLGVATQDISKAVNGLSESVDHTMKEVSETIGKSMELQKNAQLAFITTTNVLQEKILAMTELVSKLKDDITQPLKSVSESNRNVINLTKRIDNSAAEQTDAFNQFLEKLDVLTQLSDSLSQLGKGLSKSNQELANKLSDLVSKSGK